MFNSEKLEKIKKYIGSDGKLVIDDSLTETEKQDFEYINSLDVDLLSVINKDRSQPRKRIVDDEEIEEETDENEEEDLDTDDFDDYSDSLDERSEISENDDISINDLEDLF